MSTTRRTAFQAAGLVLAGAAAGGILAATVGASASSPSAAPAASYANGSDRGGFGPMGAMGGPGRPGFMHGPMQAGTVTAVGSKSVTIKTTDGTKTYAVDARSDIDKSGEAKLSDLKVGDAVHFVVRPGTSTIAVLHAGDEAKNMPGLGRGHHGPCPGMDGDRNGARPTPTPTSSA